MLVPLRLEKFANQGGRGGFAAAARDANDGGRAKLKKRGA
jgi:hypothetical protein